jgi:hypothetical protein
MHLMAPPRLDVHRTRVSFEVKAPRASCYRNDIPMKKHIAPPTRLTFTTETVRRLVDIATPVPDHRLADIVGGMRCEKSHKTEDCC